MLKLDASSCLTKRSFNKTHRNPQHNNQLVVSYCCLKKQNNINPLFLVFLRQYGKIGPMGAKLQYDAIYVFSRRSITFLIS